MRHHRPLFLLAVCALLVGLAPMPRPTPVALAAVESPPAPLDAAPLGLNTHLATRYPRLDDMGRVADVIAQSGAGWVREDLHWWRIQPDPNTWDWSFSDQAMRELIRRKINIVGVLGHPPGWATPFPGDDPAGISFYPPNYRRFAVFARAVAQRYGRYIHHWEIWNEPDNALFWKPAPDPAAYAELLIQTSAAIRDVRPDAQILIGGFNPFDTEFVRRVAEAGAWNSFDILAIHPYVDPAAPEAADIAGAADGVRALAARFGPKPIWATEVGWSSGPGDHDPIGVVDEQTQANYLVRATLLLWRAGVERVFWYTLKDDPGNPYGLVALGEGQSDYTRLKPAFFAFSTLGRQIAGAEFVALRDLFDRTVALDFESFGAWQRGDQPYGSFSQTTAMQHRGGASAQLDYAFPSSGNDYVVFRRNRPALLPAALSALGLWVYGDGSGNVLKLWLRDTEGEILQYTLGPVGPPGWRLLQAPIVASPPAWDRISNSGNGQLDLPARLAAIVLDDAPDSFRGSGTIYLDDLTAISGPEAYNLQLRQGDDALDVLWAPGSVRAAIRSAAAQANVVDRDGATQAVAVTQGRIILDLGPAPVYVFHTR